MLETTGLPYLFKCKICKICEQGCNLFLGQTLMEKYREQRLPGGLLIWQANVDCWYVAVVVCLIV